MIIIFLLSYGKSSVSIKLTLIILNAAEGIEFDKIYIKHNLALFDKLTWIVKWKEMTITAVVIEDNGGCANLWALFTGNHRIEKTNRWSKKETSYLVSTVIPKQKNNSSQFIQPRDWCKEPQLVWIEWLKVTLWTYNCMHKP